MKLRRLNQNTDKINMVKKLTFDYSGMHNYYEVSPQRNPKGPETGIVHVMRGGAFSTLLGNCRCSFRIGYDSSTKWDRVGFRCVRDAKNEK